MLRTCRVFAAPDSGAPARGCAVRAGLPETGWLPLADNKSGSQNGKHAGQRACCAITEMLTSCSSGHSLTAPSACGTRVRRLGRMDCRQKRRRGLTPCGGHKVHICAPRPVFQARLCAQAWQVWLGRACGISQASNNVRITDEQSQHVVWGCPWHGSPPHGSRQSVAGRAEH